VVEGNSNQAGVTDRTPAHLRDTAILPPYFRVSRFVISMRRKLLWMASLRIAMMLILVLATTLFTADISLSYIRGLRNILMWVGLLNLVPATLYFPLIYTVKTKRGMLAIAAVQVTQDCLFAAIIVFITGGTGSAFTFFFSLSIIVASVLIGRLGSIIAVSLSFLLLGTIGVWETGAVWHPGFMADILIHAGVASVLYALGINTLGFVGIGLLAQYLSEQLKKADIQRERFRVNLEDLKQLHESILASVTGGIITFRLDNRILHVNRAAEALLGLDARSVKDKDIFRVLPEVKEPLDESRNFFEIARARENEESRFLNVKVTPLLSYIGDIVGRILFVEDVTQIRQMEEQMQARERMATIGKLAAVVAHEIRNPLASISASSQMLKMSDGLGGDERKAMGIVVREAERLSGWISSLLAYSSPGKSEIVYLDLRETLQQVVDVMRGDPAAAQVDIGLDAEHELRLRGDPQRLHRVFMNLIKNALEAMPGGGRLRVSAMSEPDGDGRSIVISIADNGKGIPEEDMGNIFNAFHTTKARGTGLGLATVKRNVEESGGTVDVRSQVNVGSVFTVRLPVRSTTGELRKSVREG